MRNRLHRALWAIATAVLLAAPLQAEAHTPPRPRPLPQALVQELVRQYAAKYGIPQHIAHRLVTMESGWRQHAVSRRGARGIMQLRPRTARGLRVNIYDTRQNIEGGMRYLRQLRDRFKRWDLALAAYHSGPTKVARYRGIPPKSRGYVRWILNGADPVTGALPKTAAAAGRPPAPSAGAAARTARSVLPPIQKAVPFSGLRQRLVAATGEAVLFVTETVQEDAVVLRTDTLVVDEGDVRLRLVRTYMPIDGAMTLVTERMEEDPR
ncbi:MAG TPA: transglycosylase SLT domain-containing protein [bacterium]|nr:transglycosylase SLT domain-containing protein [bacterium]